MTATEIRPQPGPQSAFLESVADIVVYGGAAGGGKTFGLLLDPIRFLGVRGYGAVIFRRRYPDITAEGGLWDESWNLYPHAGGKAVESPSPQWTFPSGATVSFRHIQHAKDRLSYKGAQIAAILFDQLEEFEASQFWYLTSRNRSTCGVRPYIRATVNPPEQEDHWLYELIGAWVLPDDPAYPMAPGELRYFTRDGNDLVWVDADWRDPDGQAATSITFIPATIYDNPALLSKDPGYLAKLRALPYVDRERLLNANWLVRAEGGRFKAEWFRIQDEAPARLAAVARAWDEAATDDDGDWTAGAKVGLDGGVWYILDVARARLSSRGVDALMDQTAALDGRGVEIILQQEPGASGKKVVADHKKRLAGYIARSFSPTGSKPLRIRALESAAEAGNVVLIRGPWNRAFINEATGYNPAASNPVDDQLDAVSGAMQVMTTAGGQKIAPAPAGTGMLGSRSRGDNGPRRYGATAGAGARYGERAGQRMGSTGDRGRR